MASKGKFIVLEGIDGCGKSTIAILLAKKLKGSIVTKEPTTQTGAGKTIHAILKHKIPAPSALEMQKLYIEDRVAHTKKMQSALAKAKALICQRYAMSTLAYGMAFGVSQKNLIHDFLKADLTILLDLPVNEALVRINKRKENIEYFEKKEKLEKIRKQYLKLVKKFNAKIIDATQKPDVIIKEILAILES